MSSLRVEDLKDELNQLKDRISIKLKQGISKHFEFRIKTN